MVTTTFTYLPGGFVFEFVKFDDGSVRYNLMPDPAAAAPVPPLEAASPPESSPEPAAAPEAPPAPVPDEVVDEMALTAAPLPEPVPAEPPYTKKQRTFMGAVRSSWVVVFSVTGEGVTYAADNLAGLSLPPGTGIIVGATLYGAKRAIWPDTKL